MGPSLGSIHPEHLCFAGRTNVRVIEMPPGDIVAAGVKCTKKHYMT